MELKVIDANESYTHLALIGKMDITGCNEVENKFIGYTAARKLSAVVDVSGVTFMGSMGLRVFLSVAKVLALEGRKLVLLKPSPLVNEVLEASGLGAILLVEQDTEAAINQAST